MVRMERVLQKCEVELMLESEMAKFCRTDTRRTDTRSTLQVENDGMALEESEEPDSDSDLEVDPDSDHEEDSSSEGGWRTYDGNASDHTEIDADDANESASEGDCSEDDGGASDDTDSDADNVDDSASEADSEDAACEKGAMEATPARNTMSSGFQDSRWVAAPLDFAPTWAPAPTRTVPGAAGMSDTNFGWLSLFTPRTHPRVHILFKGHVTVGGFRHVGGILIPHDHSFSSSW